MSIDLDKLEAWEARLSSAEYTPDALAELAHHAMPELIAFARDKLWAEKGDPLADDTPVDLDKLEQLARAASEFLTSPDDVYRTPIKQPVAAYFAAANPAAVLELIARVRAAEAISKAAIIVDGNEVPIDEFLAPGWFGAPDTGRPLGRVTIGVEKAPTYDELRAIVRNLAACRSSTLGSDGTTWSNDVRCCSVPAPEAPSRAAHLNHAPDCPWRRAVEATKP